MDRVPNANQSEMGKIVFLKIIFSDHYFLIWYYIIPTYKSINFHEFCHFWNPILPMLQHFVLLQNVVHCTRITVRIDVSYSWLVGWIAWLQKISTKSDSMGSREDKMAKQNIFTLGIVFI